MLDVDFGYLHEVFRPETPACEASCAVLSVHSRGHENSEQQPDSKNKFLCSADTYITGGASKTIITTSNLPRIAVPSQPTAELLLPQLKRQFLPPLHPSLRRTRNALPPPPQPLAFLLSHQVDPEALFPGRRGELTDLCGSAGREGFGEGDGGGDGVGCRVGGRGEEEPAREGDGGAELVVLGSENAAEDAEDRVAGSREGN